jgi:sporadic carbohydrate cluster 2OG-Fe(II) oxygenase
MLSKISKINNVNILDTLNIFKKVIDKNILKENSKYDNKLENIHKFISPQKINDLRLKSFRKINQKLDWKKYVMDVCDDEITSILGSDILIQSKINLSIQMPKDKSSKLSIHSDSWSADTPFQINLWLPLTSTFDTNSMFVFSKKESLNIIKKLKNNKKINFSNLEKKIKKQNFLNTKFGEFVLFNPALLHGNVENKTSSTRVSLNIRLKSMFSPEPSNRNPDRRYGTYYEILKISENTKFALEYLDL